MNQQIPTKMLKSNMTFQLNPPHCQSCKFPFIEMDKDNKPILTCEKCLQTMQITIESPKKLECGGLKIKSTFEDKNKKRIIMNTFESIKFSQTKNNIRQTVQKRFGSGSYHNGYHISQTINFIFKVNFSELPLKTQIQLQKNRQNQQFLPLEIKTSSIENAGMGVFVTQDIQENKIVMCYFGQIIPTNQFYPPSDSVYQIGWIKQKGEYKNISIDPVRKLNGARFINSGAEQIVNCEPILGASNGQMMLFIKTVKPIKKGQQLFYSYGQNFSSNDKKFDPTIKNSKTPGSKSLQIFQQLEQQLRQRKVEQNKNLIKNLSQSKMSFAQILHYKKLDQCREILNVLIDEHNNVEINDLEILHFFILSKAHENLMGKSMKIQLALRKILFQSKNSDLSPLNEISCSYFKNQKVYKTQVQIWKKSMQQVDWYEQTWPQFQRLLTLTRFQLINMAQCNENPKDVIHYQQKEKEIEIEYDQGKPLGEDDWVNYFAGIYLRQIGQTSDPLDYFYKTTQQKLKHGGSEILQNRQKCLICAHKKIAKITDCKRMMMHIKSQHSSFYISKKILSAVKAASKKGFYVVCKEKSFSFETIQEVIADENTAYKKIKSGHFEIFHITYSFQVIRKDQVRGYQKNTKPVSEQYLLKQHSNEKKKLQNQILNSLQIPGYFKLIYGEVGIGKTCFMKGVIARNPHPNFVFINMHSLRNFNAIFKAIVKHLNIKQPKQKEKLTNFVQTVSNQMYLLQKYRKMNGPIVLILDQFEDISKQRSNVLYNLSELCDKQIMTIYAISNESARDKLQQNIKSRFRYKQIFFSRYRPQQLYPLVIEYLRRNFQLQLQKQQNQGILNFVGKTGNIRLILKTVNFNISCLKYTDENDYKTKIPTVLTIQKLNTSLQFLSRKTIIMNLEPVYIFALKRIMKEGVIILSQLERIVDSSIVEELIRFQFIQVVTGRIFKITQDGLMVKICKQQTIGKFVENGYDQFKIRAFSQNFPFNTTQDFISIKNKQHVRKQLELYENMYGINDIEVMHLKFDKFYKFNIDDWKGIQFDVENFKHEHYDPKTDILKLFTSIFQKMQYFNETDGFQNFRNVLGNTFVIYDSNHIRTTHRIKNYLRQYARIKIIQIDVQKIRSFEKIFSIINAHFNQPVVIINNMELDFRGLQKKLNHQLSLMLIFKNANCMNFQNSQKIFFKIADWFQNTKQKKYISMCFLSNKQLDDLFKLKIMSRLSPITIFAKRNIGRRYPITLINKIFSIIRKIHEKSEDVTLFHGACRATIDQIIKQNQIVEFIDLKNTFYAVLLSTQSIKQQFQRRFQEEKQQKKRQKLKNHYNQVKDKQVENLSLALKQKFHSFWITQKYPQYGLAFAYFPYAAGALVQAFLEFQHQKVIPTKQQLLQKANPRHNTSYQDSLTFLEVNDILWQSQNKIHSMWDLRGLRMITRIYDLRHEFNDQFQDHLGHVI